MISAEDKEMVVDYLFGANVSGPNVRLALKVLAAGDEIRRRIIERFLKRLEEGLEKRLGELFTPCNTWKVKNNLIENVFDRWESIHITKDGWQELFYIALCPEYYNARGFLLGVRQNWEKLQVHLDKGEIKQAVESAGKPGGHIQKEMWPYWDWVDSKYRDWNDTEILFCLHENQGEEAIDYFTDELTSIAQAVEKPIDNLVASFQNKDQ